MTTETDVGGLVERLKALDAFTITDGAGANIALDLIEEAASAFQSAQSEAAALRVERDELIEESRELSKALTGLTCGGSEFCVRRGERYVADIPACVEWVRRRDTNAHKRFVDAMLAHKASEAREAALRERVGELEKGLELADTHLLQCHDWIAEETDHTGRIMMASNFIGAIRQLLLKDNPNG